MFYPVTVYGPDGKVKRIIPTEKLHRRHWRIFRKERKNLSFTNDGKRIIPKWWKDILDLDYNDTLIDFYH